MVGIIGETIGHDSFNAGSLSDRVEILKKSESLKSDIGVVEHATNRTKLENGNIIIEAYTENGKLVKITPPGYLPFDKIA